MKKNQWISFLLFLSIILSICPSTALAKEPKESKYIDEFSILRSNAGTDQVFVLSSSLNDTFTYDTIQFDSETTSYDLMLVDGAKSSDNQLSIRITPKSVNDLYGKFTDGTSDSPLTAQAERAYTAPVAVVGAALFGATAAQDTGPKMASEEPVVRRLIMGIKVDDEYTETEIYTFNFYRKATLASFAVSYEDGTPITEGLPAAFDRYLNNYEITGVKAGTEKLVVTAPAYTQTDTVLKFDNGSGSYIEGTTATAFTLDLTAYGDSYKQADGSLLIPFMLDYTGTGCGVDGCYTLRINIEEPKESKYIDEFSILRSNAGTDQVFVLSSSLNDTFTYDTIQFDSETTTYDLMLVDGAKSSDNQLSIRITPKSVNDLYGKFTDGTSDSPLTAQAERAYTAPAAVVGAALFGATAAQDTGPKMASEEPVVRRLIMGIKVDGEYTETEIYTFNFYRKATLASFAVSYEDGTPITEGLPATFDRYLNNYEIIGVKAGTEKLVVTAPAYTQTDTVLKFDNGSGSYIEGTTATTFTLDLTAYGDSYKQADGSLLIPFMLDYTGTGCGVDGCYTLRINIADAEPEPEPQNSIIDPETVDFDKYTHGENYKDIVVMLTLNGNTLKDIWNGETRLTKDTDYTVSGTGTAITLKTDYLTTLATGTEVFRFEFSAGVEQTLIVNVSNSAQMTAVNGFVKNITINTSKSEMVIFNAFQPDQGWYDIDPLPMQPSGGTNTFGNRYNISVELSDTDHRSDYRYSLIVEDVNGELLRTTTPTVFTSATVDVSNKTQYINGTGRGILDLLDIGEYTFIIKVFKNDSPETIDEYAFHLTFLPVFSDLTASANGKELAVLPEFGQMDGAVSLPDPYFIRDIEINAGGEPLVILKSSYSDQALFPEDATVLYRGEDKTADFIEGGIVIDLNAYEAVDGVYLVPISVVHSATENTRSEYTLHIIAGEASIWEITAQPQGGTFNKGDSISLSVTTDAEAGAVSYQWQCSRLRESFDNGNASANIITISGATNEMLAAPSDIGGTLYYRCKVTDEKTKAVRYSEIAEVTINLGQYNAPVIIYQPGSYASFVDMSPYRTEYSEGEKIDMLQVMAGTTESGRCDIAWYYNTQASMQGAMLIDQENYHVGVSTGFVVDSVGHIAMCQAYGCSYDEALSAGEHYFYCVVTVGDDTNNTSAISDFVKITVAPRAELEGFEGKGTEDEPYLIKTLENLKTVREYVLNGDSFSGTFFRFDSDITLPVDWEPIGVGGLQNGKDLLAFSGIIDGNNKTLTVAKGGKPLLNYARDAIVKNLNIFGEEINGAGLLDRVIIDYGTDGEYQPTDPDVITIENVILLRGSKTRGSGLVNGGANSGINDVFIKNCTIEEGVTIGYTKDQNYIGSFVGRFNGRIENSISYATVYGTNNVGGLVGGKSQAMGDCEIINCAFIGSIEATGGGVGGIIGAGYAALSAPNTPPVTVRNCYVNAQITGNTTPRIDAEGFDMGSGIGGIVGSEIGVSAVWNDGFITDNYFFGTITDIYENTESGYSRVGGILGEIGYYEPEHLYYENNYYLENRNYKGVGQQRIPNEKWNPEQDSFLSKEVLAFTDGTVLALLNQGSYRNWVKGEEGYPVHSDAAYPINLTLDGEFKTEYVIGDSLDMTGATFILTYSDDAVETLAVDEITFTGFDSSEQGVYTVTATYDPVFTSFTVRILLADPKAVTVSFVLYGDTLHGTDGETHTLADGNLTEWIARAEYEIDENTTVLDVFEAALTNAGFTWVNDGGNYISSINNGTITLAEKANGPNSGWMYTLNGEHPQNGVAEQFLSDGDCILFHYSDEGTGKDGMTGSAVQSMAITTAAPTVKAGEKTEALTVSFTPALLDGNVRCEWTSSDTAIAEVDKNGVVTGIEEGIATITATAGGKSATITVTVTPGETPVVTVESITISPESLTLKSGETGTLTATVLPADATAKTVTWTSSDTTVATVRDGVITALKAGSATITATAGGKSTTVTVTVEAEAAPTDPLTSAARYMIDTVPEPGVGSQKGEWVILGLARSDFEVANSYYQGYYDRLCALLEANDGILPDSITTTSYGTIYTNTEYSRVIVALTAIGKDPKNVAGVNLLLPLEDFENTASQGVNGSAWALIAMDAGQYEVSTREQYIADILAQALPDGGWNLAGSGEADPDITGMVLQALAKYTDRIEVKAAVDLALAKMSELQNDNGGFSTSGDPTVESNVQMLVALNELGISLTDERFVKNGKTVLDDLLTYQNSDGSFRHIAGGRANQLASEQALYALVSNYRAEKGMTSLYRMTEALDIGGDSPTVDVESITLDQNAVGINENEKVTLTAIVLPVNATDRSVVWTSSNEAVAKVENGVVTGVSEGTATITAKAGELTATCVVTVSAASQGGSSSEPSSITVSFTLLGDSEHDSDSDGLVHGLAMGGLQTWISRTTYTLDEGATVRDLFELALTEAGLSWTNPTGNYVEYITYNGLSIGEFSNGRFSGWMYTLNGVHSSLGLDEQDLSNGDVVIWHYTDDYRKESGSEGWSDSESGSGSDGSGSGSGSGGDTTVVEPKTEAVVDVTAEVTDGEAKAEVGAEAIAEALENTENADILTVKVESEAAESVELTLDAEAVMTAADSEADLHIETEQGTVKLDADTLSELAEAGGEVAVSIESKADGSYTVDVTLDGETADVTMKVALPTADEGQVLVVVNEDGTEEIIKKSVVEGDTVYAELPAGATVKVIENSKEFSDVSDGAWYAGAVDFASSHDLFRGVSEDEFAPQSPMTRAMLATVLFRLEDEPEGAVGLKFGDVKDDSWYTDAVAWASENGIVNGTGSGFEPNANITREQIATMIYRYVNYLGIDTDARGNVSKFKDGKEVSSWASDAMAWAVEVGLFKGDDTGSLNPKADATRAEVATLMERLVGLIVK